MKRALALVAMTISCGSSPPRDAANAAGAATAAGAANAAGAAGAADERRTRPAWCEQALDEIRRAASVVPARDVAPPDVARGEALARRMAQESDVLAALAQHDAVQGVAEAANTVSAAAWALVSRRHAGQGARDGASTERALAVVLRERERAVLVLRGHCGEVAPSVDQSTAWKEATAAALARLAPAMRACAAGVSASAPAAERPKAMHVLVHIDPRGRATFAAPVDVRFALGQWGPTDLAHCFVKELEGATYPEPEGTATILVPFAGDGGAIER